MSSTIDSKFSLEHHIRRLQKNNDELQQIAATAMRGIVLESDSVKALTSKLERVRQWASGNEAVRRESADYRDAMDDVLAILDSDV